MAKRKSNKWIKAMIESVNIAKYGKEHCDSFPRWIVQTLRSRIVSIDGDGFVVSNMKL